MFAESWTSATSSSSHIKWMKFPYQVNSCALTSIEFQRKVATTYSMSQSFWCFSVIMAILLESLTFSRRQSSRYRTKVNEYNYHVYSDLTVKNSVCLFYVYFFCLNCVYFFCLNICVFLLSVYLYISFIWIFVHFFCLHNSCAWLSLSLLVHMLCWPAVAFAQVQGHKSYRRVQSCKMAILLHGAKPLNQILPEEKRVNCDSFDT